MHASVRGQRGAANMMLVQMQLRCAHLVGVLDVIGNSPDHGIIGTASLGTSKARVQTGNGCEISFLGRMSDCDV